ncbi:MAG TPA: GNAT family N-acetyltransferase [Nocardioidaceae bacterium]|nr:GNAT family N-acetyltransferase [Nocardioidaceae bacterium]
MATSTGAELTIRPMRTADLAAAERVTAEGFYELEMRTRPADLPPPSMRSGEGAQSWVRRVQHILEHDPEGCWVAESGSGLVGVAVSMRRDLTWILATYAVRPGFQGHGLGRQLLEAALSHGRGCLRGMLAASADPRAARRYRQAGFRLHPTMSLTGVVDRTAIPLVERVREGSVGDVDLMNSVDRQVRDAAHGVDHELLASTYRLLVVDRSTGSGYAYSPPGGGGPYLLAATNRRTATALLWEVLAGSAEGEEVHVDQVTDVNEWALDVGMTAGLSLHCSGYLALRHMKPPRPYLPSAHFL